MSDYRLTETDAVVRTADNASIPNDPANRDRREYERWLADGGVPDPYVAPPPPGPMSGDVANARLDAGIDAAADSVTGVTSRLLIMPPHSTPPTVEELQAQVDYLAEQTQELADATRSMLEAQATTTG